MDWSNPDSIFHSYDTLQLAKNTESHFLVRFWIDPSSSIKQYIEIKDTIGGYKATRVIFGQEYNLKDESKMIFETHDIHPKSKWDTFIKKMESFHFIDYESRYHSWYTDGGPMHTAMIWYRVEYFKGSEHNDFVFWKFADDISRRDMENYEKIVSLIDSEFF